MKLRDGMHRWMLIVAAMIAVGYLSAATADLIAEGDAPDPVNTHDTTDFIPLTGDEETIDGDDSERADLITISLDDVVLVDVVRMFGRISGANIIATPEALTARVTANLQNVEWRPALSSILAMHNMALVERTAGSGVYSVVERLPDAPEPMFVRTYFLKYTTVGDVTPVVRALLPERGSLSTFPSRSALVVRSTEGSLKEIETIIENIDIQSRQVAIEAQFMELTDSASQTLGLKWESLENFKVGFQAGPFTHIRETERGVTRQDSLERGDTRGYTDANSSIYDVFGTRVEGGSQRDIDQNLNVSRAAGTDITQGFTRTIREESAAVLEMDTFNLVLSALKSTTGVSVISNPKMIVASGTTNAYFRVGEREPLIRETFQRGTPENPGGITTYALDSDLNTDFITDGYLETGIELSVVPTVKTDDLIEAEITPSLRTKVRDKEFLGNSWPVITVKEIRTLFTLSSGQTVAIGGLTDTTSRKETSKVPLLGDIPIIGRYLFSHSRDVERQVETIIFVTLSLAEPKLLASDAGIPERAELVHKRRIQADARRVQVQEEVRLMEEAARLLQDPEAGLTDSHSGLYEP